MSIELYPYAHAINKRPNNLHFKKVSVSLQGYSATILCNVYIL